MSQRENYIFFRLSLRKIMKNTFVQTELLRKSHNFLSECLLAHVESTRKWFPLRLSLRKKRFILPRLNQREKTILELWTTAWSNVSSSSYNSCFKTSGFCLSKKLFNFGKDSRFNPIPHNICTECFAMNNFLKLFKAERTVYNTYCKTAAL
jgi:hypothetical protein